MTEPRYIVRFDPYFYEWQLCDSHERTVIDDLPENAQNAEFRLHMIAAVLNAEHEERTNGASTSE